MGFTPEDDVSIPVMIEMNLRFAGGVDGAFARLEALWERVTDGHPRPSRVSEQYAAGELSMQEMERLVAADAAPVRWPRRSIIRLWPDFPVRLHVDASCVTVKADAARRSFNAYGDGIVWAVIDSGIWGDHPHFAGYHTLDHDDVKDLHRTFPVLGEPTPDGALVDDTGHGTHVAGIIAGAAQPWLDGKAGSGPSARPRTGTTSRTRASRCGCRARFPIRRCWPEWHRGRGWSVSRCCSRAARRRTAFTG